MTPEQEHRALRAQSLVDDATLNEAWDAEERQIVTQWAGTEDADWRLREALWARLKALRAMKARLRQWASDLKRQEAQKRQP